MYKLLFTCTTSPHAQESKQPQKQIMNMSMTTNSMAPQNSMNMKMTDEAILLQLVVTEDMLSHAQGNWFVRTKLGRTVCWYLVRFTFFIEHFSHSTSFAS